MRIEYFADTDTLQITFSEGVVADTRDLDEKILVETAADGRLLAITVEHARERTDPETLVYKTYRGTVA